MLEHRPSGTCAVTKRLVVDEADSTEGSVSFLIGT